MKRLISFLLLHIFVGIIALYADTYTGYVFDEAGQPVSYATIYPINDPVAGTATNSEGYFSFTTDLPAESEVIVSFIGYQKQTFQLADLHEVVISLREQPIALEETVIAARQTRHKNKRKQMAYLLHQVFLQMQSDFSHDPVAYDIVSDVRMDTKGESWGMEQMIAHVVELPEQAREGRDSVQFRGEYCKRYFRPDIRKRADTILAGNTLENLDNKKNKGMMRKMVNAVDSGVAVHHALWAVGNIRYDFEKYMNDISHWTVTTENDGETVLTHKERHNYIGIFILEFHRHYILDSETLSVRRFSEQCEMWVSIPFGMKLNADHLRLLNLLNLSENEIEKFRLRRAHANIHLNTIYCTREGHIYTLEKNLHTEATLTGTRRTDLEIPVDLQATQRATRIYTQNVQPMPKWQMTRRIERKIVEIY